MLAKGTAQGEQERRMQKFAHKWNFAANT